MSQTTEQAEKLFCWNVCKLRKEHGLTKKQMADIMGVGVRSVRMIERGELPPRLGCGALYALAEYFDLPADAFFSKKDV